MRFKIIPVLWLLFVVLPTFARDVEILLEDTELGLPLEGAVIRSWDGKQYICNEHGKALVSVPDDRRVVIQAAYPGYETGRLVIMPETNAYTLGLRLSNIMQGKELVVEASQPGTSETKTGRSVALSGREIAQTAEIGIIEDVMNSVKLLPGVGYTGLFNGHPSIRGGEPADMSASLDGFYISNPYYWGGGFSIFDPRMVQSAQLSHGVFSSRYGNTISGLLDVTSKKPSFTETEFELGVSTSTASYNLSFPLAGKGGILFMGRVTYYDPIIWVFQQASKSYKPLEPVNAIETAPYIRSETVTGNYRFSDKLELQATGFWGMDGIGLNYENITRTSELKSDSYIQFDYTNYQGFITSALSWNPRNDMLLKLTAGTGYTEAVIDGELRDIIYNKEFKMIKGENDWYYDNLKKFSKFKNQDKYNMKDNAFIKETEKEFNVQGRVDYDWELKDGLLLAAGMQERFNQYTSINQWEMSRGRPLSEFDYITREKLLDDMGISDDLPNPPGTRDYFTKIMRVRYPVKYNSDAKNRMFTTSGYGLTEYSTPGGRFNTELGLRVDHFYLIGKDDFSLSSKPALNPRLNLDFNVFKNQGIVHSFDLSAGTGLFSSINTSVSVAEKKYNLDEIKPNRSWTSIVGTKLEFSEGLSFNIEGYYKFIFDRTYFISIQRGIDEPVERQPRFNGEGRAWGIDVMLQKLQSRFWDGWISYSFSWVKHYNPDSGISNTDNEGGTRGNDWFFPSYHRFHNLNLILNVKPAPRFNIYTRFGFASGAQIPRRIGDRPISYPVYVYTDNPSEGYFTERYYWPSERDENNRTTPSLPMDLKFSIFGKNKKGMGKSRYELYFAMENVLSLLYTSQGNTRFNENTGEIDTGSEAASYEIPIPIPSFGFKYSY